ncbi:MAG: arylsulfatase [Planctomycetaceae bacterium]|nr:arylsulfatase [Planctomycetaceae bacterium]
MKHSLVLLCAFLISSFAGFLTAEPPNVIVFLTDDQGWGDLSLNGNENLSTPHIDALAREGASFDRFYVCPVCSPTRAEFLTGRYHPRGGVKGVSTGEERLDLDEVTIADTFKQAGYATAAFGKWHNGTQYPYHPRARGFDEYYGMTSGHWGHYFSPILDHNGRIVRGKGYVINDLTDHALDFIEKNHEHPFFCYLPYNTPHSPFQVPDEDYRKFADAPIEMRNRDPEKEEIDKTRAALAMCENIDHNVGRILNKLDELQLTENTIVVYFTDNGPNTWRWNGGMKGKKGATDEGGVRVPCLIRWPGQIPAGIKIPQIAAAIDLLPTLTDLAGIEPVGRKPLDGKSLKPLLTATAEKWPERMIFSKWQKKVSVRTQRYRLDHTGKLFDMIDDPGQHTDISNQLPEVAKLLRAEVGRWKAEMNAELSADHRPLTLGYATAPETQLPARDGDYSGHVARSGRAPNCSFFTNWTSTEDRIWWDVDVLEPGTYDVLMMSTCEAQNVGARFELSLGEANLTATAEETHDPPLHGAEADRANRGSESYVKDFKEWKLGQMTLTPGEGRLSLRALEIPGRGVVDVRMLIFRRTE